MNYVKEFCIDTAMSQVFMAPHVSWQVCYRELQRAVETDTALAFGGVPIIQYQGMTTTALLEEVNQKAATLEKVLREVFQILKEGLVVRDILDKMPADLHDIDLFAVFDGYNEPVQLQ